jgi:glycosyltransferase involved in cell wall biosynthesis
MMTKPGSLLLRLPAYAESRDRAFSVSVLVPVYNERHVVETRLRHVLALKHELIRSLQVIVVDDGSTDGSWEVLQRLAAEDNRIVLRRLDRHHGTGAAIRTAISHATGDISIVPGADMERSPADIPSLLAPFSKEGADAVLGAWYQPASHRRALMPRHRVLASTLTALSNWLTDLRLTDITTCYTAVSTTLLKSIPIRSDDVRFEVELIFKLAKRRARLFEVPVRCGPWTQEHGKTRRARDSLLAVLGMLRFALVDDLYRQDEYGSHILVKLERARHFNLWMGRMLRPYLGTRVLEIGAGIGNLTSQFIPRELYVASDVNPHYLHYLRSFSFGKPYLRVLEIDAGNSAHFRGLEEQFDTALMVNVLEHLSDEHSALRNLWSALETGGRAVVLVPQHPSLCGTLDRALEHRRRYTRTSLARALTDAGFRIETLFDFNRFAVPGWWWNGKVLRRRTFSRVQLKIANTLVPLLKRVDHVWPWRGLSVVGIGVKE